MQIFAALTKSYLKDAFQKEIVEISLFRRFSSSTALMKRIDSHEFFYFLLLLQNEI